ncbi:protein-arginine deiminase domain-containing protein [Streptomyces sp. NPDC018045]|uniref:protein-arginine deiminase domain-containing protein n=1 Tax=Streptomyces sp. NPDC018045 TaxID=3365037 RepID=UPI0037A61107
MSTRSRRTAVAVALVGTVLLPAVPVAAQPVPVRADLRADVDRDGVVDVTGLSDEAGEERWTPDRGAVFLPNIDDDAERCRTIGPDGKPLPEAQLDRCNDASDEKVDGKEDEKDLARLRTVPVPNAADGATGTVRVTSGARQVRLFLKRPAGWEPVTPATRLSAAELRAGVELGLEGKDVVRDRARWDGTAHVDLTVTSGGTRSSDRVALRVAPLLTHHHLQRAQRLLVTRLSGGGAYAAAQREFVRQLDAEAARAGITEPPVMFTKYPDVWAQDFVEPAYASMPGPGGRPRSLRIMLRSAQDLREAGRQLFEKMRGPGVGVVQLWGAEPSADPSLDSMGNLETIPPYTHQGRSFPAGRVIMGERQDSGAKPAAAMRELLEAQGAQSPLLLDTSWLAVGHVDEFVQFLPAATGRGWTIGVADPEAGMKILRAAAAAGHGAERVFSAPDAPRSPAPKETIAQALASATLRADNALATRRIKANLEILRRATGVTDAEVVRVPALFTRGSATDQEGVRVPRLQRMGGTDAPPAAARHGQRQGLGATARSAVETGAYLPGAVNGVLLGPDRYLAPRQWGPVIDGKDVFAEAVTRAYRRAGLRISYIDDFHTYHAGGGEVHCGTNTLRDTSRPWWTPPAG